MNKKNVLSEMWNYIENSGMNWQKIQKHCCSSWLSVKEWCDVLEAQVSPQLMTVMFKEGLVARDKDKQYFGDNNFRYFPIVR